MTRLTIVLDVAPCRHPNAIDDTDARLYVCPDCGSKFPLAGDTDLWAEGIHVCSIEVQR